MKLIIVVPNVLFVTLVLFASNAETKGLRGFRQHPVVNNVKKFNRVVCPDGKEECVDGTTCCKLASGGYGCCTYDNAVCCSDKKHCCPEGFTCDVSRGMCDNESESFKFEPLIVPKITVLKTPCDPTYTGGTPCTKYPFKAAACCSDGNCCPHGHICNIYKGTCDKASELLRSSEATRNSKTVLCPGGKHKCPERSTCCMLPSKRQGCCPLPEAICCADGQHCCPHGYRCNSTEQKCVMHNKEFKFLNSTGSVQKLTNVTCPGKEQCPHGNTCCKSSSGGYKCCPKSHAVCCSDGKHCCPHGYICDTAKRSCIKRSPMYLFNEEFQAFKDDGYNTIFK